MPKTGCLTLVTGGVKCGKSTFSVALVRRDYKQSLRIVKFKNFFKKLFHKPLLELPLVYSNVPLAMPYVPITRDLLTRKKRFRYGSVVYIQEASLVADSQLIRDMDLNNRLLLFNKLIGHEGASLIYDTQSVGDIHYSIKRSLSQYFYIHHISKWLPFFLIVYVQESRYSEDNSVLTISDGDVEDKLKRVIIPKRTWKYFDSHCYSYFTDDLPVEDSLVKNNLQTQDLKAKNIVSFRDEFCINKSEVKNEKENVK